MTTSPKWTQWQLRWLLCYYTIVSASWLSAAGKVWQSQFRDVTQHFFANDSGYLAAFGDFDSDKSIDVFVLLEPDKGGGFRRLDVNLGHQMRYVEEKYKRVTLLEWAYAPIDGVVPVDLDGDLIQDVVVFSKRELKITIFWGTGNYSGGPLNINAPVEIKNAYREPLLFDFNGDRVVDLLTSIGDANHRHVLNCRQKVGCEITSLSSQYSDLPAMTSPHSNSFVDIDGDLNPDLVISTKYHFEIWLWRGPSLWEKAENRPLPGDLPMEYFGQSLFVDFDSSGKLSHLIQGCTLSKCNVIYVYVPASKTNNASKWAELFRFKGDETFWFDHDYLRLINTALSLRQADLNQDGYPDIVTIIQQANRSRALVVLKNRPCRSIVEVCVRDRFLEFNPNENLLAVSEFITNVGIFDFREDGRVDLLLSVGTTRDDNWRIVGMEDRRSKDVYFLKVIIVSGLCGTRGCRQVGGIVEYGYNQPGPLAKYVITTKETSVRTAVGAQLYQTCHGALQLPYLLFGIGLSPNFIDSLEVRMPGLNISHQYIQIIPNSQIVVIPHPINEPEHWGSRLFVTPSRRMLQAVITLCGVLIVNVLIVAVLHLIEKKADRLERRKQAHWFNFDAM